MTKLITSDGHNWLNSWPSKFSSMGRNSSKIFILTAKVPLTHLTSCCWTTKVEEELSWRSYISSGAHTTESSIRRIQLQCMCSDVKNRTSKVRLGLGRSHLQPITRTDHVRLWCLFLMYQCINVENLTLNLFWRLAFSMYVLITFHW